VDQDGEFFVTFPDLPGCMTGAPTLEELPAMIREGSGLWLEVTYENGREMPVPTIYDPWVGDDDDYSGKFNLRLPRSLHRALAEAAERDGVSLNQHVLALLARGEAEERVAKATPAPRHRVAEDRPPNQAGPPRRRSAATKPTTSAARKPRRKTTR
jgi:predicted RNase H-like HicB family nuclease